MKKFSFVGSLLLLATVVTFLFIGCHKEAGVAADEPVTASGTEGAVARGTDDAGYKPSGLIDEDHARELAAEFLKTAPKGSTRVASWSIRDMMAYLRVLSGKYKADSVYVTFGTYNKNTAHNPSQIGRNTIFFTGNNLKDILGGKSGKPIKTNGTDDDGDSYYLNGSGMPQPALP